MKFNRRDMMIGTGAAAGLFALGSPTAVLAQRSSWIPGEEQIDALHQAMGTYDLPGLQIAIIEDGELAWRRAFGVTNIETGQEVTDQTLFQGGSLTKPLFAYIVMKLVEEGRLSLDDRLAEFYRPDDYSPTAWNAEITIRHALAHQTGLVNWRPRDDEAATLEAAFEPGSQYSYSGEAYYWLQQVCEVVTGLGLQDLLATYVLRPAGLTDMAAHWLPENDHREVYGHEVDDGERTVLSDLQFPREHGRHLQEVAERWGRPMTSWRSADLAAAHAVIRPHTNPILADWPLWRWGRPGSMIINSAYSLRTTASDYARFMCAMLPQATRPDWHVAEAARQMMLTPQTERSNGQQTRPVGLGWFLERWEGSLYFGHTGVNRNKHVCLAFCDQVRRRGLVMMTNARTGGSYIHNTARVLTGTQFQTFN